MLYGTPGRIRTHDLLVRSQALYPAELRALCLYCTLYMTNTQNTISLPTPERIQHIVKTLHEHTFEGYIVGGCVRDTLLQKKPTDWDITTNATPEDICNMFPHTVYENDFGTVLVVSDDEEDESLKGVEITPYRKESTYSDNRRPDTVVFGCSLEEDLARRDFTINAIAYDPATSELRDPFGGVKDLHKGIIRTVRDPKERFDEDALRLMRAVRIATQLGGTIEKETYETMQKLAERINTIAIERVRDEFTKIINTPKPHVGVLLLEEVGLLQYILPELREGIGVEQNQAHAFDVFEHSIRTLAHAGEKELSFELRLAALLHDISKPETRAKGKNGEWSFHNHEVVGARKVRGILKRLKYPNEVVQTVSLFVRWHMFFSDTEKISLSAVRRMVARVGEKNIWELVDLRKCDRIGTGRPKEQPYKLRKYKSLIEEVLREPITPGKLTISGETLIQELHMKPGPKIGNILHILLAEVLDDPTKNNKEYLLQQAKKLVSLDDVKLAEMGEKGKIKKFEEEQKEIQNIRSKNFVE